MNDHHVNDVLKSSQGNIAHGSQGDVRDAGHLSMMDCPGLLSQKLCQWFSGKD